MEWDFTLATNATKTLAVQWYFTAPAAPRAPQVTNVPASTTTATTAAPHFAPASGDTQVVGYECSLDGAAFVTCATPASLSPAWPTARTPTRSARPTRPPHRTSVRKTCPLPGRGIVVLGLPTD